MSMMCVSVCVYFSEGTCSVCVYFSEGTYVYDCIMICLSLSYASLFSPTTLAGSGVARI